MGSCTGYRRHGVEAPSLRTERLAKKASPMKNTWLAALVPAVALTFAAQAPAMAHVDLVGSDPAEGAVLDVAPDRVRLEFEETVEAEFNPIEVYDEEDNRVDLDDARVEPDDPSTLTASLGELSPGETYMVEYRVTSQDGDPVAEAYSFVLSEEAEVNAEVAPVEAADSPAEEPEDEGIGFGTLALYGGLILAGLLALRLTVFGRKG